MFANSAIRRLASEAEIPKYLEIAKEAYPERDVSKALPWISWALKSPNHIILIGDHSFCVASTYIKYGMEKRALVEMLASRKSARGALEALQLCRAVVLWATLQGATQLRLGADTGVDFGPFAARLGGVRAAPSYDITLGNVRL